MWEYTNSGQVKAINLCEQTKGGQAKATNQKYKLELIAEFKLKLNPEI